LFRRDVSTCVASVRQGTGLFDNAQQATSALTSGNDIAGAAGIGFQSNLKNAAADINLVITDCCNANGAVNSPFTESDIQELTPILNTYTSKIQETAKVIIEKTSMFPAVPKVQRDALIALRSLESTVNSLRSCLLTKYEGSSDFGQIQEVLNATDEVVAKAYDTFPKL
jgi:hypothetical protein